MLRNNVAVLFIRNFGVFTNWIYEKYQALQKRSQQIIVQKKIITFKKINNFSSDINCVIMSSQKKYISKNRSTLITNRMLKKTISENKIQPV